MRLVVTILPVVFVLLASSGHAGKRLALTPKKAVSQRRVMHSKTPVVVASTRIGASLVELACGGTNVIEAKHSRWTQLFGHPKRRFALEKKTVGCTLRKKGAKRRWLVVPLTRSAGAIVFVARSVSSPAAYSFDVPTQGLVDTDFIFTLRKMRPNKSGKIGAVTVSSMSAAQATTILQ